MGLTDRLKDLKEKAEDAVVERKDQIHASVEKAAAAADQRTGGKYHEKIHKAGDKALGMVDNLRAPEEPRSGDTGETADGAGTPAADA